MAKIERISPKFPEEAKAAQIADSESDSDPDDGLTNTEACSSSEIFRRTQVIHSGHFMVSSPHSDTVPRRRKSGATVDYDFDTVNKPGCQTYSFGPFSSRRLNIDPTLTRLFECMTLAYSGKIVSPKWKSFKGLRLLWRDKIRLNNAIWRAWFIQYVEKRKSPVCGFITPLEGSEADAHHKPAAIVLEGSYWKRQIEVVIKEYHKWRIYYKKRKHKDLVSVLQKTPICRTGLEKWSNQMYPEGNTTPDEVHMFDLDCFLSDISDTLFTMTQKPCPWTDERQTYTSNADMIQPGLTPLQPNLDDLMDIPDIFTSYRGQALESSAYADYGFFEAPPNVLFAPALSAAATPPVRTEPQLTQSSLAAESVSQSSAVSLPSPGYLRPPLTSDMSFDTSSMTSEPKFKGHSEYIPHGNFSRSLTVPPGMDSYGPQQSYGGPAVAMATSPMASTSIAPENPYLYPTTCLKYRHPPASQSGNSIAASSTVITHTGSGTNILPEDPQLGHNYPSLPEMLPVSLGYQPVTMATPPAALPLPGHTHCFTVPQQVGVASSRGKHKQKSGGTRVFAMPTAVSSAPPTQTSCLAKLLSSSTKERKPTLAYDTPFVGRKGHRPVSPAVASTSSMSAGRDVSQASQHAPWAPAEMPPLTPLQSPTQAAGAPHGSVVSSLLTQGPPLLIPKTEKLSPVQIQAPERTSLTVNFSGNFGPTSPTITPETAESSHSLTVVAKTEPNRTDTRRITHISAEQKRRFNIKLGFDTLHSLVTTLSSQPSVKISKATTLQKTAEYISKMQQERTQLHEEAQRLRDEILVLNSAINVCQQQLPATGVPITRQRFDHMREKFREYVRAQTLQNWKFWIFSVIMEPLFESYNGMVSTASMEDMCRTTLSWLDQHCSLPALRPTVLSSLRCLSTSTSILTDPSLVPEQATQAVTLGLPSCGYNQ
ncbi:carbohydrate-responsive element-binding protein isoform X2 [Brachyhypopomus gauderio]|uniref:carbohydrate-responsive element-binding protein isoform X2 n=1 Tax=Brachyhypopomus gauderio TaxID=698409 RepID=UPI00404161DB